MKKIAIVGTAPTSSHLAPYDNPEWEVWVLNKTWMQENRWNRLYEIHGVDFLKQKHPDQWHWLTQMQDGKRPIVMQEVHPEIKGSQRFDLQRTIDRFGQYFTNSVSYMIADAIFEQPEEIGIWGVDMALGGKSGSDEYAAQRPSCEYLIGCARGAGIKVHVPKESDLLKCKQMYGYMIDTGHYPYKHKMRDAELLERMNKAQQEINVASKEFQSFVDHRNKIIAAIQGALGEREYQQQWGSLDDN